MRKDDCWPGTDPWQVNFPSRREEEGQPWKADLEERQKSRLLWLEAGGPHKVFLAEKAAPAKVQRLETTWWGQTRRRGRGEPCS